MYHNIIDRIFNQLRREGREQKIKNLEINSNWQPCIKLTVMFSSCGPIFNTPQLINIPSLNHIVLYYMTKKHALEAPLLTAINP